jgi:hypothetical protein
MALACGAPKQNSQTPADDGGNAAEFVEPEPPDAAIVAEPELPSGRGKVEITARWLWPPAEYRRSPGRNSCGSARPEPLRVELMGGLSDTLVVASNGGDKPTDALLSLRDCRLSPKLVVVGTGSSLIVQNLDESNEVEIVVERMGDTGEVTGQVGKMPMRVIGHRYALKVTSPGLLRLHSTRDPSDFAYALAVEHNAAVSTPEGVVELELPAGSQELRVWHPPVEPGKQGISRKVMVEVQAKMRSKQTVDLSPAK